MTAAYTRYGPPDVVEVKDLDLEFGHLFQVAAARPSDFQVISRPKGDRRAG
jgi:hypothetical protein